ncbi:MAG TPA: DinB family protein [Gemmatimonadaceae bacterium]|nr:DinB family protein [Gemmatimonadaceae bacterium]
MRSSVRITMLTCAFALASAVPAAAQSAPIVADLASDVGEVEKKFLALAKAIPAEKYDWSPGKGVRSVGEVIRHVASDNYLIPAGLGWPADASTGIKGDDYKTAQAFEKKKSTKDQSIADLEKSFAHLKKSMNATTSAKLGDQVQLFGQPFTMQRAWVLGTTHLHEHLGQLIAYARTNGVKPPWS